MPIARRSCCAANGCSRICSTRRRRRRLPTCRISTSRRSASNATLRQRMEAHRANAVCASCHAKMDPLGFGLENFDASEVPGVTRGQGPGGCDAATCRRQDVQRPCRAVGVSCDRRAARSCRLIGKDADLRARARARDGDRPAVREIAGGVTSAQQRFSTSSLKSSRARRFKCERQTRDTHDHHEKDAVQTHGPAGYGRMPRASRARCDDPCLGGGRAGAKPVRSLFIYAPNGMVMKDWTPPRPGPAYELTPILKAFAPFRDDMLVLTGLMDHNGNALGDGGGDHARAGASFLTGVHPRRPPAKTSEPASRSIRSRPSAIGSATRLRSLELGCEDSRTVGNCDSGYSCAYTNSLSWRGPSTPNPPETNPRAVFERLFGADDITLPAGRAREAAGRPQEHPRFGAGAGARDRRRRGWRRPPQNGRVPDRRPRDRRRRFRRPETDRHASSVVRFRKARGHAVRLRRVREDHARSRRDWRFRPTSRAS